MSGHEPFSGLEATLLDFWRFAMSDLRTNTVRGYLAEFLVARAMGALATRVEWDSYDVLSPENIRIEVKAGGYVQAWTQTRPSGNPSWDIPQTIPFDPETGKYLPEAQRGFQADVYVFAVHEARTHADYEALNLAQWTFHVLDRAQIEAMPRGVRNQALATFQRVREAARGVAYEALPAEVRKSAES
ncbi:hypothetical protein [Streptomyces camponoticapitis]|uniref:hypothetical protein n=1 Tax=Streptomyces camponoticapitis TaxID=1616125 RepID=UPI00166E6757|nr:hypothetical protein [Streptomyces camponoticapitis]